MLTNTVITAWNKLTGSDEQGRAQYASQALARPLRVAAFDVTSQQLRYLESIGKSAERTATYQDRQPGVPSIAEGDRVQLGGAWHQVTKCARIEHGALGHRMLYLTRTEL